LKLSYEWCGGARNENSKGSHDTGADDSPHDGSGYRNIRRVRGGTLHEKPAHRRVHSCSPLVDDDPTGNGERSNCADDYHDDSQAGCGHSVDDNRSGDDTGSGVVSLR
jgi:hypothetical protein